MIEQKDTTFVKMNGVLETTAFNIKTDDGKMFHILSNLYSNPLGAVVRELSTNCCDGHKIAGNEKLPFDILLPGKFDSNYFITFRDYGLGMPEEIVKSIFTTFGQSTKNNSNLETGCLGLGSKSPLAISDSFTVTSVNDGIKTTYSVSKDEQRKPVLAKFGTMETEELNGLIVTVPLNKHFQNLVKYEIKNQLRFFKVKPRIFEAANELDTSDMFKKEPCYEMTDAYVRRYGTTERGSTIIQGEVQYSFSINTFLNSFVVDSDIIGQREDMKITSEVKKNMTRLFDYYKLDVFMEMGSVSFAPSREELIYDNPTCKNILDKLILINNNLINKLTLVFDKFDNLFEYFLLKRRVSNIRRATQNTTKFTEDDINYLQYIGFDFEYFLPKLYEISDIEDGLEFEEIISARMFYHSYDKTSSKNIIKTKNLYNQKIRSATSIFNFLKSEFSKIIKHTSLQITVIQKNETHNLKHSKTYTSDKTSHDENFKLLVITTFDKSFNVETFIEEQGLSMECFVPFEEIKKHSLKCIEDGKVKTVSTGRKIRKTSIQNIRTDLNCWPLVETTTYDIKETLTGLYIPSYRGEIMKSDKFKEFPILEKILNDNSYKNILNFLSVFGKGYNSNLDVYHGNEKYFKTTKLVHIDDYILAIINRTKYLNAWHALNRETLTYKLYKNTQSIKHFKNNMNLLSNGDLNGFRHKEKQKELFALIQQKSQPIEKIFADHPLLALYNEVKDIKINTDHQKISAIEVMYLSQKELLDFTKLLDIKIEIIDYSDTVYHLENEHRARYFFANHDRAYWEVDEMYNEYIAALMNIKKQDFINANMPDFIYEIEKNIPCNSEEYENDNAIAKHDNIAE